MESYFKVKAKLFTHEYADMGFINIDDKYGARLFAEAPINTISLSRLNPKATWHYTEINPTSAGVEFTIRGKDGVLIESRTSMHGGFNLDNLLLAVAIAYESGVDPLEITNLIPNLSGAPGRLQAVNLGQSFKAHVDYAHSPDAVENVLQAVREFTPGRVIAVLGCGGNRDATKRPLMGNALTQGSDIAIFTSDNPRNEDPKAILDAMVGAQAVSAPSKVILDRAEAIAYAVEIATAGDSVIVLGKGHESGQEINGVTTDFDDRIQLAEAIEVKQ
jgi:UDP-N-acetylmuramoyl-L-alanyl-D-glutamate--2,6-diaminopimelate ligase